MRPRLRATRTDRLNRQNDGAVRDVGLVQRKRISVTTTQAAAGLDDRTVVNSKMQDICPITTVADIPRSIGLGFVQTLVPPDPSISASARKSPSQTSAI